MWEMIDNSGNYTSSQELAGEYLADCCVDTDQFVQLKSRSTQEKYSCNDSGTECCQSSPSGTMSAPSMESHGEDQLMLFAEDSPAKILVRRVKEQELPENVRAYGRSMQESLTRYGLSMSLPKTLHCFELGDLELSSKTWPKWGMMQDGECWELGTRALPIKETECGSWPTPATRDYKDTGHLYAVTRKDGKSRIDTLGRKVQESVGAVGLVKTQPTEKGSLNPSWVEWLMNWPINWTSLEKINNEHFKYWQEASATHLQRAEGVRELWWDFDPAAPPQGRGYDEQRTGEHPDPMCEVSRKFPRETEVDEPQQETELPALRSDIYLQEVEGEILQSELCKSIGMGAEEVLPRVAHGVKNRVDRLKAIGNGQVPEVARLAWNILSA